MVYKRNKTDIGTSEMKITTDIKSTWYDSDGCLSLPRFLSFWAFVFCVIACFISVIINSSGNGAEVLLGLFTASGGMYVGKKFSERRNPNVRQFERDHNED